MRPIYNDKGEFIDVSDEGEQAKSIENKIELAFLIKKLPLKEQPIAIMISEGYSWREIAKSLHISEHTIAKTLKHLKKTFLNRLGKQK